MIFLSSHRKIPASIGKNMLDLQCWTNMPIFTPDWAPKKRLHKMKVHVHV